MLASEVTPAGSTYYFLIIRKKSSYMTEKHNLKILILDEQASFKDPCKEKLLEAGYRNIETTDDPIKALDQINRELVSVVIFDVIISKIDGIEFMRRIARMNISKKPMLIVCSAISIDSVISQMIALGADYYMIKPLSYDVLVERIDMLFPEDDDDDLTAARRIFSKKVPRSREELEFELEKRVTAVISEIGIPAHVKGYHYLRAAILMTIKAPDSINAVTKVIYPTVAKHFDTSSSRVERAIRHAIEVAWGRGNIDTLDRLFGYSIDDSRGKPTNSEFIAIISDFVRLENREFKSLAESRIA